MKERLVLFFSVWFSKRKKRKRKSLKVSSFVIFLCVLVKWYGFLGQVYKISIGAACGLSWPSDRLVIQVLDDSTDPAIKVHATQGSEFFCLSFCDYKSKNVIIFYLFLFLGSKWWK